MNPLDTTRTGIVERINKHPWFQNVQVILDEKGDVENQVEQKLATLGLALIFEMETGKPSYPNIGSYVMDLAPVFTIQENVLINRDPNNNEATGKTASDVLCKLYEIFHPMQPGLPILIELQDFELIGDTGGVVTFTLNGKTTAHWTPIAQEITEPEE